MFPKFIQCSILSAILLQACHSTKPLRPMENYDPDATTKSSILNLPIKLYKSELEKTINQQLGDVLFEDDDYSDGLLIKATKQSDVTLEVADKLVKYSVPINLWVKKDVMITSVEAEGSLILEFETNYRIQPNWQLETNTLLKKYEWTRTPVVKLGFGNLNVTSIANQFIDKARGQLAAAIDDQVKSLIDLKGEVNSAWIKMQTPILVSEEHKTWILMSPDSVRITPLTTVGNIIESTVIMTAKPRLFMGKKPENKTTLALPNFQFTENPRNQDFSIFLGSEIPFEEAERITRENLVGQTYNYGKKKIKVEDISLYGQGNKLVVKTNLSGSYEGEVYLTGKPEYNDRKNEIVMKEVDFDFSSKKTLMKTASWLFKGSLKKTIQDNLNFHLNENLEAAQKAIEYELENFDLGPGIKMVGNLDEINVSHVYISATGINVKVGLSGNLHIEVNEFSSMK